MVKHRLHPLAAAAGEGIEDATEFSGSETLPTKTEVTEMKMAASCETTVIYRQWLVAKCNEALELSRTILLPLVTKHLWLGARNSILGRSPTQSVGP